MRHTPDLPRILTGRGQLFHEDRSPIDVRYQIVLATPPAVPVVSTAAGAHGAHAAPAQVAVQPSIPTTVDHASGHLVVLNRADIWRIDFAAEYQLALTNGRRCRVVLHHDPYQPLTKYRIFVPSQDLP